MRDYEDIQRKFKKVKPYIIFLVVPLVMVLVLGTMMKPVFVDEIPFAIMDLDKTSGSEKLVNSFKDSNTFKVTEDIKTLDEMEQQILYGNIQGGLVIPKGLLKDIKDKKGGQATLIINGENIVISNNIQAFAWKILNMANAKVEMMMLEAGGMSGEMVERNVYTLNIADRVLFNPTSGYLYYLFPVLLAAFVQQTILATVPQLLIESKVRIKENGFKKEFKNIFSHIVPYSIASFISTITSLIILDIVFDYLIVADLSLIILIQFVFMLSMIGPILIISSIFDNTTTASQFTLFLTVPTVLTCGYAWPTFAMSDTFATAMKALWPLYYFANPLKDLMMKNASFGEISNYIFGGLMYAGFWAIIGIIAYRTKVNAVKQVESYEITK